MLTVARLTDLRLQIKQWRQQNLTIAFVPTMGNLHAGHLSLVKQAQQLADKVVVSIFVNPLQFDDKADLSAYPRTLANDTALLTSIACDLVFTPTVAEMYPNGMEDHTNVVVANMDDKLCGLKRPGHFDGVATVVLKLLNMVQADIAVFGEKDYQQLLLIKTLVSDLNLAIDIVGGETYREENGLAMSSRNQYLTLQQREQAAAIYQSLLAIKEQLEKGNKAFAELQQHAIEHLQKLGFKADYVDIRRADNLDFPSEDDSSLRILLAARLGTARLIDNIACDLA